MPTLHAPTLLDFATRLFAAAGVPEADASVVAQNLVGANLRGHDSHGVLRIPQYVSKDPHGCVPNRCKPLI